MFSLGAGGGWMVNAMPQLLYPPGKKPAPVVLEAGWALGLVWMGLKNLAPTRFCSLDCAAHSKLLYWLHYPNCAILVTICKFSLLSLSPCSGSPYSRDSA